MVRYSWWGDSAGKLEREKEDGGGEKLDEEGGDCWQGGGGEAGQQEVEANGIVSSINLKTELENLSWKFLDHYFFFAA